MKSFTVLYIILFSCFVSNAQQVSQFSTSGPFAFEENKGQLANENGKLLHDIKYYGKANGAYVYIKNDRIAWVFSSSSNFKDCVSSIDRQYFDEEQKPSPFGKGQGEGKTEFGRLELQLLNSNPNPKIIPTEQQESYTNYYTAYTPNDVGITQVHSFKKLTYKSIYNNIDMILDVNQTGFEYSFIIHPGGDPNDIKIKWNGGHFSNTELSLRGGTTKQLPSKIYHNSFGWIKESEPISFSSNGFVNSELIREENTLGFRLDKYDKSKDIVIDPKVEWATFYGGNSMETVYHVTTDQYDNVYTVGYTQSSSGLATSGAYKTSLSGTQNVCLVKFNTIGKIVWSTYYGGGDDLGFGITCDKNSSIYICGATQSSSGIATSGAFQTSGGSAFLSKFSYNGSLVWGTYYGSNSNDDGVSLAFDKLGNIVMAGRTRSTSGIATTGAYQTSKGAYEDAYLVCFSPTCSRLWGTYYGGNDADFGSTVAIDANGNIYLWGNTFSTSGIATSGSYQTGFGGSRDHFLVAFSSYSTCKWATYVGGSGYELDGSMTVDAFGNIYTNGYTTSTSGLATSGAYQSSFGGGSADAYMTKFNSSGKLQWATYFSGNDGDFGYDVICDKANDVWFCGRAASTSGFATPDGFKTSPTGTDAYIAKFTPSGTLKWGSYFGGKSSDWAWDMTLDKSQSIYITGYTNSTAGLATSGAYQTAVSGSQDGFIAKIQTIAKNISLTANISLKYCKGDPYFLKVYFFNQDTIQKNNVVVKTIITGPVNYTFYDTLKKLNPSSQDSLISKQISALSKSGNYTATIYLTQKDSNPNDDTVHLNFKVGEFPVAKIGLTKTDFCPNSKVSFLDSSTVAGDSIISRLWTFGNGDTQKVKNPVTTYNKGGFYKIKLKVVSSIGCTDSTNRTIYLYQNIFAGFKTAGTCAGRTTNFTDTSIIPVGYKIPSWNWNFGEPSSVSNISTLQNPTHTYLSKGYYTVSLKITTDKGCTDSITTQIFINNSALPQFSVIPNICLTDSAYFANQSNNANIFFWKFGDGTFSTQTSSYHTYKKTGVYSITLIASNSAGCNDSINKTITVSDYPIANFSFTNSCAKKNANFTDKSTGNITSWSWDFGDFTTSTVQNPSHVYAAIGSYDVTLTVTTPSGCKNTVIKTITVTSSPTANFSATSSCVDSVSFTNQSLNAVKWQWDFGDLATSTEKNPYHVYLKDGNYKVKLIAEASGGCIDSSIKTITVSRNPVAKIGTISKICQSDPLILYADSVSNESGTKYTWDFGDGSQEITSYLAMTKHMYTKTENYTIKLKVTSPGNCTSNTQVFATILASPVAKFGISSNEVCVGNSVQFTDSSTNAALYDWDFGEGNISVSKNPTHAYNAKGRYSIKLTVTSGDGCITSIEKEVTVHDLPDASFNPTINGKKVNFNPADTTFTSYSWDFGDASSSTQKSPEHNYASEAKYMVKLTVIDKYECESSVEKEIEIKTSGLSEVSGNNFQIYPNPASSKLYITSSCDHFNIRMSDISGRILISHHCVTAKTQLDISSLTSGCYLLEVENKGIWFKFIKN